MTEAAGLQASLRQPSIVPKEPHKEKEPWCNQAYRERVDTATALHLEPRRRKGWDLLQIKKTTLIKFVSRIIFLITETNSKSKKIYSILSYLNFLWRREYQQLETTIHVKKNHTAGRERRFTYGNTQPQHWRTRLQPYQRRVQLQLRVSSSNW